MQNPSILLADEPTASLDPKTSERIMELISSLTEELNLPVLINLHNVAQAKHYAARIVGLRDGVMVFDGTPDELTNDYLERIYTGKQEISDQKQDVSEKKK